MTRSPDDDRRRRHRQQQRGPQRRRPPSDGLAALTHPIAVALAAGHPLDLLAEASGLLEVLEERQTLERVLQSGAGASRAPSHAVPSRTEFLASLIEVDLPETTALLTVFQHLSPHELERRTIARAVAARNHPLPAWLGQLGEVRVGGVLEARDVFGDAVQYMLEVDWPDGTPITVIALINANQGHALADALVLPGPLSDLADLAGAVDGLTIADADPADARARVEAAIARVEQGDPLETDAWPMARPLVEWAFRLLPTGGAEFPAFEPDAAGAAALVADFAASPQARGLDWPVARRIAGHLCRFAADNCGDPLRWSPAKVAQLLTGWWVHETDPGADADAALPDVVKAFVRFCGTRTGLPPRAIRETVEAVDALTPDYRRLFLPAEPPPAASSVSLTMRQILADEVGGVNILDALDDRPLPDEPFDWGGLPQDIHAKVGAVLALFDAAADEVFDVEFRTAGRRLLAHLARVRPEIFRRRSSDATAACAIAQLIATVNSLEVTQKSIAEWFGLSSAPSSRVATFAAAAQAGGWASVYSPVAHVGLLGGAARRRIIRLRDDRYWE